MARRPLVSVISRSDMRTGQRANNVGETSATKQGVSIRHTHRTLFANGLLTGKIWRFENVVRRRDSSALPERNESASGSAPVAPILYGTYSSFSGTGGDRQNRFDGLRRYASMGWGRAVRDIVILLIVALWASVVVWLSAVGFLDVLPT